MKFNKPIRLLPASAWRSYNGGKLIAELHGNTAEDGHFPEEWIMSTVTARNPGREDIVEGLSMTPDGRSLKSIIEDDPAAVLGERHYKKYGASAGVLVKLLDSAERLAIQVHPTREAAKKLFDSAYGKTECWHIIKCREINGEKPCVYLGFKEGITREFWKECFDRQDITAMLGCLNRFDVEPGETYLVCGGVPHAIGAGCLLIEIQEPTDYTIRTEKVNVSGFRVADKACHQGLGFERMFDCFEYNGLSEKDTAKKWRIEPIVTETESFVSKEAVGYRDTDMFRLVVTEVKEKYTVKKAEVFSGLYILDGSGTVDGTVVKNGDQFFVPAGCDDFDVVNEGGSPLKIFTCYGPK